MNRWTVRRWWRRLRRRPAGSVTVTITADVGPYLEALARARTVSTSSAWTWVRPVVVNHTTGGTVTVARICTGCLEQLPAAWGCTVCQWIEERMLCEPAPRLLLARPCKEHT